MSDHELKICQKLTRGDAKMGRVITFKTLQGEYKNGLLIIMATLKSDTAIHGAGAGVKAMQVCSGVCEYFRQYNKTPAEHKARQD